MGVWPRWKEVGVPWKGESGLGPDGRAWPSSVTRSIKISEKSMKQWERLVRWWGQFAVGSCVPGTLHSWVFAAHTRVGGRSVHTCPHTPTGCGSAGCGRPSGPFAAPRRGSSYPNSCSQQTTQPSNTRKAPLTPPPNYFLLIGSSAHGMMRAAAGGPAVPSRRPARAGEEAGCVCRGARGRAGVLLGCGRLPGPPGPGGGAPGLRGGHRPSCSWSALQRRSVARLGASSAGLLAPLAFLLRGLLLLPRPRRPLLQPAPPLPLCLPSSRSPR